MSRARRAGIAVGLLTIIVGALDLRPQPETFYALLGGGLLAAYLAASLMTGRTSR